MAITSPEATATITEAAPQYSYLLRMSTGTDGWTELNPFTTFLPAINTDPYKSILTAYRFLGSDPFGFFRNDTVKIGRSYHFELEYFCNNAPTSITIEGKTTGTDYATDASPTTGTWTTISGVATPDDADIAITCVGGTTGSSGIVQVRNFVAV